MPMMMEELELPSFNETNHTRTSSFSEPDSLIVIVPLSVIYGIIFVSGILGNISTCIVIGLNRSMHTATNFYLFSLAISDLLLLICGLPLEVYQLWSPFSYPLGEPLCITVGLMSETSANASILTITAFTVDRYIAICSPFIWHKFSKLSRVVRYIIAIWICALCFAIPQVVLFAIVTYEKNEQIISACTVKEDGVYQVFVISSSVLFVVPMSLIIVLYVLIGVKLHKSRILHPMKKTSVESGEQTNGTLRYRSGSSKRRVIKMLVAVTLSFFLCWAPFHVQRLLAVYGKNLKQPTDAFYKVYEVLTPLSGVMYFLSTSINPFLYNFMSNKFRNAFKVTLSLRCRRRDRSRLEMTYGDLLAAQRERAASRGLRNPHNPRRLLLTTISSQSCIETAHSQCLNRSILSVVNQESESRLWRQRLAERSDSLTSLQSISSSSLIELDQELSGEENIYISEL